MARPHITDGVAALVGRAVDGVGWAGRPLAVWQGGVGLQSVAKGRQFQWGKSGRLTLIHTDNFAATKLTHNKST